MKIDQNKLARAVTLEDSGKTRTPIGEVKEIQRRTLVWLCSRPTAEVVDLLARVARKAGLAVLALLALAVPARAAKVQGQIDGLPPIGKAFVYSWSKQTLSIIPSGRFELAYPDTAVPPGWTSLEVPLPDGRHVYTPAFDTRAAPPHFRWDGQRFAVVETPGEPHGEGRPLPPLFAGNTLLGFTYYDGLAIGPDVRAVDFQALADRGFSDIEIWLYWRRTPGASVIDEHGNWLPGGAERLRALLDQAQRFGLYVNTRVAAGNLYRTGSHDSTSQINVTRNLAPFVAHPAFLGFDVANEGNERDKGPSSGGQGWAHISSGEFGDITRAADPKLRLTVSIAGPADGKIDEDNGITPAGAWYCTVPPKGGRLGFAAPHDPRTSHSGSDTEAYVRKLRAVLNGCGLGSLPIGLTEPFRRPAPGEAPGAGGAVTVGLDQYEAAVRGAKRAGAAIWALHHGHFIDASKPVTQQLDSVERQAFESAAGWLK